MREGRKGNRCKENGRRKRSKRKREGNRRK